MIKTFSSILTFTILSFIACSQDTVYISGTELLEKLLSFRSFADSTLCKNEQYDCHISNKIEISENEKVYELYKIKESDTLFFQLLVTKHQTITEFKQYFMGKPVGLSIENNVLKNNNPYAWEGYDGFDRGLMMPSEHRFICFLSWYSPEEYYELTYTK